jgi:organic radical activating enzyme
MLPRFNSLLVSITEKCHAGCAHCGFHGSPRSQDSDPAEVGNWVEQACRYGVPIIIFTGGEPFERIDALASGVAAAAKNGGQAAVFTSSIWAHSAQVAFTTLKALTGLQHLYLSSDRFHQKRIPYERVHHVIDAALKLAIPAITICIAYADPAERDEFFSHYSAYGDRLAFCAERVIPNPSFSSAVLQNQGPLRDCRPEAYSEVCKIGTPLVNPNGDLFSCHVGTAAAHTDLSQAPYYLGSLRDKSFHEIIAAAVLRPDYQFLRTHGARGVAQLFQYDTNLMTAVASRGFTAPCDMCFTTLSTPEGRSALRRFVCEPDVHDTIDIRLAVLRGEDPLPASNCVP